MSNENETKPLKQPDVMLSLPTNDEIETQIYRHLETLPYAGGYPHDWKETLSIHLGKWLRERKGNGA